ncbi:MAG: beta-ketoacyl-ACP synthase II [Planctomycetes bacterium]|nr:beta-ketoacyl-ACP synthase II [Planctomycetota bacterium]
MERRRVVITGLGAITALGNKVEDLWASLCAGKSGISEITAWDASQFDCRFGGEVKGFDPTQWIPKKDARRLDRYCQFAIAATAYALEDAKLDARAADPDRVGAIIGSGIGGLSEIEDGCSTLFNRGPSRVSPFLVPKLMVNAAAGQVSILYGLRGPNYAVASACASASHAIGDAFRSLQQGEADVMITGGTEAAMTPIGMAGFCSLKALSTRNDAPQKASRPFDKTRDGFVMAEGAGILILEDMDYALKRNARIYAEVLGFGMSADGCHITAPDPAGKGAALSMSRALQSASRKPEDVSYINAHGTSTPAGDVAETNAVKALFGDHAKRVAISSTKSMVGHQLGASGAVELIACAMAVRDDRVPPTINYETPDPECDLDYVPNQARQMPVNVAMSNSFGFGGHNATLLIGKFRP